MDYNRPNLTIIHQNQPKNLHNWQKIWFFKTNNWLDNCLEENFVSHNWLDKCLEKLVGKIIDSTIVLKKICGHKIDLTIALTTFLEK